MNSVKIQIGDVTKEYQDGTTFEVIANEFESNYSSKIAIAVFNGKMRELTKTPECDGVLEFLDLKSLFRILMSYLIQEIMFKYLRRILLNFKYYSLNYF